MVPRIVVAVALVAVAGCSAFSSNDLKRQVRALAQSTAERTDPQGEFVERLNRVCTPTPPCVLSESQLKNCASLRASATADHEAALRLLKDAK